MSSWPLWLLHALGWGLGWLAFLGSGTYRKRFVTNARLAGLSSRRWLAAIGESGKLVAELPRLWLGPPVPIFWEGEALLDEALAHKRGILFLTPHLGCFEIAPQAYVQRYGAAVKPLTVLFRPPRQAWLRELVQSSRQRPGLLTAPTTLTGVKQMMKALKNGESVALLPDQVPPLGMGLMAPFFGQQAYTMTLSVRLAQQTGACVLLAWGERLPWGRGFKVHVQALPQALPMALPEAVATVNHAMETLVLQCPQQYLWGYARYKQPRELV